MQKISKAKFSFPIRIEVKKSRGFDGTLKIRLNKFVYILDRVPSLWGDYSSQIILPGL